MNEERQQTNEYLCAIVISLILARGKVLEYQDHMGGQGPILTRMLQE